MKLTRGLLPRLFLLLAGMMAVSALSWALLFVYAEQTPRARNVAGLLTSVVNLTRSALVAAAPARRDDLLWQLTREEGLRIYLADDNEAPIAEPTDAFLLQVQQNLRSSLGPSTQLTTERYGNTGIFVLVDIEGDKYWIGLPRERFTRTRSLQWIGWGLLGALAALITAVAFVSRLTRPLKRLAKAAGSVGGGRPSEPLAEDGPEEIAAVAKAFNQMTANLKQTDEDRSLILAGISHDLRTPLTRLRMGIEMTAADDEMREGMIADIDEMDRTIGQFLDFARRQDSIPLHEENMLAMLEDIAELYRRRNVPLQLDLKDVGVVPIHQASLRRAITNLIDNSLRYAGKHDSAANPGLTLDATDTAVVIEVRDRGPGIPPNQVERLLKPFTRLDSARSNTEGTGLGLAIVDRIARQHGGKVELLPRAGGGLIARLTIRRQAASLAASG